MYHLPKDKHHCQFNGRPIPDRWLHAQLWEPYEFKYPKPSRCELDLIAPYLRRFALEYPDFVEDDEDEHWILLKNHLRSPNPRNLLLRFFLQVRLSKGYDVDVCLDFLGLSLVFTPRSLDDKKFYDLAKAATEDTIGDINSQMMGGSGKIYEFVSVDKLVTTTNCMLLLTFIAKRSATGADADPIAKEKPFHALALDAQKFSADANSFVETFRAMVRVRNVGDVSAIVEPPFNF